MPSLLSSVIKSLAKKYITGPATSQVRRAFLQTHALPIVKSVARSKTEIIQAVREAGLGIRESDLRRMIDEVKVPTLYGAEEPVPLGREIPFHSGII